VGFVTLPSRTFGDVQPVLASCQLTTLILPAADFRLRDPPAELRPSYLPPLAWAPLCLCRPASAVTEAQTRSFSALGRDLTPEKIQGIFKNASDVEALVRERYAEHFAPGSDQKNLEDSQQVRGIQTICGSFVSGMILDSWKRGRLIVSTCKSLQARPEPAP
jgi:hypothetical protein